MPASARQIGEEAYLRLMAYRGMAPKPATTKRQRDSRMAFAKAEAAVIDVQAARLRVLEADEKAPQADARESSPDLLAALEGAPSPPKDPRSPDEVRAFLEEYGDWLRAARAAIAAATGGA